MTEIITARDAGHIDMLVGKITSANRDNGWHDRFHFLTETGDKEGLIDHIIAKNALGGGELHEAIEEIRNGHPVTEVYYGHDGKPEGYPIELADALIRILDHAGMLGINLGAAVREKLDFNATRGQMHGGKTI